MPNDSQPDSDSPVPEADDRLIEAALVHVLHPDPGARRGRVARVMASIESAEPVSPAPRRPSVLYSRRTWTRLAVAAVFLLTLGVLWPSAGGSRSAYATVVRVLEVARSLGVRRYHCVKEARRPVVGDVTIEQDLYVDGADRFAIRRGPAGLLPRGDVWFGSNGESFWVVPPVGPRMTGDAVMLDRWLERRRRGEQEILHITTVLEWLKDDYELTRSSNESLPDLTGEGREVQCEHVRGVLAKERPLLPAQIDLWADQDTGVARRLVLDWYLAEDQLGPSRLTIELAERPELPDDWFDGAGH